MNIAVNGIDDVQDANDTDKDDKHPAQHFDLFKAFYHLIAALEMRKANVFLDNCCTSYPTSFQRYLYRRYPVM